MIFDKLRQKKKKKGNISVFLRGFYFTEKHTYLGVSECFALVKIKMAYSWPKLVTIVHSGIFWDLSKEELGDCCVLKGGEGWLAPLEELICRTKKGEGKEAAWRARVR